MGSGFLVQVPYSQNTLPVNLTVDKITGSAIFERYMMLHEERYLTKIITQDLAKKMVFLTGPRQCGKTTLAKTLLKAPESGYLNWDIDEDRERILLKDFPAGPLWIFDEIHKYKKWRNYLKGLFDQVGKTQQILVTGSARLESYRYGGDSLQGRYNLLRLHPLSFSEVGGSSQGDLESLLKLGGFPEPFLSGSEIEANRWSRQYQSRVIREDVVDLEKVKELEPLILLAKSLPSRVGAPLSINNLREDLGVSFKAVKSWIDIFEKLYLIFRIPPFGSPRLKAVKKEQKHYHYDWNLISQSGSEGARFENLIAAHLLKWVHYQEDVLGKDRELRYFRDEEGREVDFVLLSDGKPFHFIEVKLSDTQVSPSLKHLKGKFPGVRASQVLLNCARERKTEHGIEIISATTLLKEWV